MPCSQFVVSEMAIGLRRNLTMTVAAVLDLGHRAHAARRRAAALLAGRRHEGLLVRQGRGLGLPLPEDQRRPELRRAARSPPAQRPRSRPTSRRCPQVEQVFYESQAGRVRRASRSSSRTPRSSTTSPPTSCPSRSGSSSRTRSSTSVVASALQGRPGVEEVADQRAILDQLFRLLNGLRNGALVIAIIAVVAMVLLIANTVQVAAFSRRRETGIMRLVGASNLYIQLPFVLEGALAGLDRRARRLGSDVRRDLGRW